MYRRMTLLATIARKRAIWSKTVKNSKRKTNDAQQGKSTQKKTYPETGTCGNKSHPEKRCWQDAGAHLKPKRTRSEDPSDNQPDSKAPKPYPKPRSSNSQSSSKNDDPKN